MINNFQTIGYEDMELSTQILIQAALKQNIEIEILDRKTNFIALSKNGKTEWVQQATRTSSDPYISALAMNNKIVTKKILEKNNIRVPRGESFTDEEEACKSYEKYKNIKCIVKPNTTNFGTAVSSIEAGNQAEFKAAIHEAFQHDDTVIVEEFIEGKEYRFLLIDNEVVGVLHRVAANVVGDGKNSIQDLIDIKNQSPLRGTGYKKPLEKIKKTEIELSVLAEQNLDFHSILDEGKIAYLRHTSNISTGGDSIDFTDEVHPEYKKIALEALHSMNAKICGLDIMIKDIHEKPVDNNYAIIELNFNPAIHIHTFPFQGKNRKPAEKILKLLGF